MNNKKKRRIFACLIVFVIIATLICLASCSNKRRFDMDDMEWMLGKTSSEIEERYGSFDFIRGHKEKSEDGNYYSAGCCYEVKEKRVGPFGTDPAVYFQIHFDSEGRAYRFIYPWYIPA